MSVIVYQFETVKFIQMMSLTFGMFTQVSGSGPLGPLVCLLDFYENYTHLFRMTFGSKVVFLCKAILCMHMGVHSE